MKKVGSLARSWIVGAFLMMALVAGGLTAESVKQATKSMWAERFHILADFQRGDVHGVIADLKCYLSKFGYLKTLPDKSGEDLSAEFDELLEEAIKLYQLSFKLPVTGIICNDTVKQLHTPRCGREDVSKGGRPLMLQLPHGQQRGRMDIPNTVAPGYHENFESLWAVFSPSEKWQSSHNLSFAFSSDDTPPHLSTEDAQAAITAAFNTWSSVIPVNFTEVNNFTEADIQIKFVGGEHGDGDPFDGRLGILAHSFAPEDGRFHFDSDELWMIMDNLDEVVDEEAIDLETVALHEIGHLLGLAHTQVEGAVMFPSITLGQVKRELTADDIEGAQALYGSNYRRDASSCGDISGKQEGIQISPPGLDDFNPT